MMPNEKKPKTPRSKDKTLSLAMGILARQPRGPDLKRAAILTAVVDIISEQGVDELTFERIGKRVKMARSHVVYYFPDRETLVKAAIEFAAASAHATIAEYLSRTGTWKETLDRYIEANFAWIEKNPQHSTVYALLYYLATFKPEYRKLHSQIRKTGFDRIVEILEAGPLRSTKLVPHYAKAIQGILTGNLVDVLTTDQQGHARKRLLETQEAVHELLKGA